MSRSLKTFLSFLALAALHRFYADSYLRLTVSSVGYDPHLQRLVGVLSDVWISTLLTLPVWFGEIFLPQKKSKSILIGVWIVIWAGLTAGHQGYVEFFKQQIIPFHLSYLIDPSFVEANGTTFFEVRSLSIFIMGGLLALWTANKGFQTTRLLRWQESKHFVAIAVIGLLCHVLNIRYRVQWFVPESLQNHYLESLFTSLKSKPTTKKISDRDLVLLASVSNPGEATELKRHLVPKTPETSPALVAIKDRLQAIKAEGRNPFIIVVAAESFRPADSGWTRKDGDPPSVTPVFDGALTTGVHFPKAFSTGPVTRSGQEALWCGVPTATDSSLMRSFPQFRIQCIPDLSKQQGDISLWMHGGDRRFDSQESYWRRHGVSQLLLKSDFSADTPQTGWGVSDQALFTKSIELLKSQALTPKPATVLPFILSVTNHIPWDLPSDVPQSILKISAVHPSERTTAYFDDSLGQFFAGLKREHLWQDAVIVVSSDHGNLERPRNASYAAGEVDLYEQLLSHINLALTGGVIESLVTEERLPRTIDAWTSQAQVAAFIAAIAGYNAETFMDVPLFSTSPWPIACDLNQYLYLPQSKTKLTKESVLAGNPSSQDDASVLAATRYRAFVQMLYESRPH